MKLKTTVWLLAMFSLGTSFLVLGHHTIPQEANAKIAKTGYVAVADYDPKRDAAADVKAAVDEAGRSNKRVLLEVGGKWCSWCSILDRYFAGNADILKLRDDNYVTVKINMSPENENKPILSVYPEIPAYPHLFVLGTDGKLLQSQSTGELESGRSYDHGKMLEFLKKWAPEGR
jgi:thiol:disulfide interchange protein